MAKEFKLPNLGEGITGGDVVQVLVAEGDTIKAEQPILEIETDKAVVEVPCSFGGVVAKLHVKQGEKVKVGQPLISVNVDSQADASASTGRPDKRESADTKAAPAQGTEPAEKPSKEASGNKKREEKPAPTAQRTPPAPIVEAALPGESPRSTALREDELVPAGPATRRLARELGVDLHQVAATRPGERLTEEDVKEYAKQRLTQGDGSGAGGAGAAGVRIPPLPDFSQWGPVQREPLSSLQRKTAENVAVSWSVAPHVTQFDEADISALEALRKRHRSRAGEGSVKLTVTAFVLKAVAIAIKEFPRFNSSLDMRTNELILKNYCHIGVAVDTPAGLIVPVIRDVDKKRVLDIAAELEAMAERTRQRKVALEELRGGTFTVTNLGGIGGTAFTPVINHPEVAILGLGRSREQPIIRDEQWATRLMLPLCLSYDHRVINGADGARFTRRLVALLEDPEMLLLES